MEERGTHPSANPGGTANQEDAAPVLSNHELAHNSLKNLNNGSTTTNPQTKHIQLNSNPAPAHRASQPILKPMPRYVRLVVGNHLVRLGLYPYESQSRQWCLRLNLKASDQYISDSGDTYDGNQE